MGRLVPRVGRTACSSAVIAIVALFAAGCAAVPAGGAGSDAGAADQGQSAAAEAEAAGGVSPGVGDASTAAQAPVAKADSGLDGVDAYVAPEVYRRGDDRPVTFKARTAGWGTDWTIRGVEYDEIQSGGVGRDAIPAIDNPVAESIAKADGWLSDRDPVVVVAYEGEARAYPLQVLTWHEIANDVLAGVPIAVTFCPLCNAAVVFDRRVHGEVLDFGVSGFLRNSDLVMYDRTTESMWQQLEGKAIVGSLTGTELTLVPSLLVSWADFKATFPSGDVLSRSTGRVRQYGENPYAGYDRSRQPPLFRGTPDQRLPATERVVAVEQGDDVVAYPFAALKDSRVVNDVVGDLPVVVFWKPGTASALDTAEIAKGRDVGAAGVFDRRLASLTGVPAETLPTGTAVLTFTTTDDGQFMDVESGSTWDIFGRAVDGILEGAEMALVVHGNHFWFAWAAFRPETRVWGGTS